jgi:hypothetical protein
VKERGGAMREHSIGSTGEHRRHQMSLATEQPVPYRIHPLLHSVQTAGCDSLVDNLDVKPQGLQLPQSHQPVLPRRQLGELPIRPYLLPTGRFPSI